MIKRVSEIRVNKPEQYDGTKVRMETANGKIKANSTEAVWLGKVSGIICKCLYF